MDNWILVDSNTIQKTTKLKLKFKGEISEKLKHDYTLGLVLNIPEKIFQKLNKTPLGKERISFLDSKEFLTSVQSGCFIFYSKKNKMCILNEVDQCFKCKNIENSLNCCLEYLPRDTNYSVCIPITEINKRIKTLVDKGFCNPFLSNIFLPTHSRINQALYLSFDKNNNFNYETVSTKIKSLLQDNKANFCSIYCTFSHSLCDKLKKCCYEKKELTGEFYIEKAENKENNLVYTLNILEDTIAQGEDENVDVPFSRYNFHSHPESAYKNNNVKYGWPSLTDYLGVLKLGENTIFHCVSTLEGIYIISFGKYWGTKILQISSAFIEGNYNINKNENISPQGYCEKINNIKYKNYPIFKVEFFPWDVIPEFQVHFPKIDSACFLSQKSIENHEKIKFHI